MTKECTDGEYPCEMSSYIHGVEMENTILKDFLKELYDKIEDDFIIPTWFLPFKKTLKVILNEYPDFIREREKDKPEVKEIVLLKRCAAIFEEMDDTNWNEDSSWQCSSYELIANEVYKFLNKRNDAK